MAHKQRTSSLILPSRRMILTAAGAAGLMAINPALGAMTTTPPSTAGPYYPSTIPQDNDVDLTKVAGQAWPAAGHVIEVVGRLLDQRGQPLVGDFVEIWQADSFGIYHHPSDPNRAKADPGFQGYGIAQVGSDGAYRFRTIKPKKYGSGSFARTPHIHFRILHDSTEKLVTQMYFPDEPLNKSDSLFNSITGEAAKAAATARLLANTTPERYQFDIVV